LNKAKNSGNGKLVIQTYNPEHPVIKAIRGIATENFYENELEKRKSLKYPPFYQIIKLTLRTQHKEKIEKESELIFKRLKTISEENSNILVFTPFVPQLSKIRDKFRKQIIMKVGGGSIPKNLKKYLESLGGDWIIDIDPISLT
jgi:primosomal protein N' (replication factor Y)